MTARNRRNVKAIKKLRDVSASHPSDNLSWKRGDIVNVKARAIAYVYAPGTSAANARNFYIPVGQQKTFDDFIRLKDETIAVVVGMYVNSSAAYGKTRNQLWLSVMLMNYGGKHVYVRARDVKLFSP